MIFLYKSVKRSVLWGLPIVSIVAPFFGFNPFYIKDPKR